MKSTKPASPIRIFSLGVYLSLIGFAFFFWIWYERYLKIEFNELGRYYDAENQIVYTDSAFIWCLPSFGFLLLTIVKIAYRIWQRKDNQEHKLMDQ